MRPGGWPRLQLSGGSRPAADPRARRGGADLAGPASTPGPRTWAAAV
ncbi:hypothetical protein HBB16_06440 [Pseudonocardia sp. MCCB 268]|nr:hypothetical protein [Pseudonocardia cytotoxica]